MASSLKRAPRRFAGSQWRGHQCRADDDETERDDPSDDRQRADPDRVAQRENAAHDRRDVGGNRGERDYGHARTELEPASRGVEPQRSRKRGQSPLADDPMQPPCKASVRYFSATSDTPNSAP